MNDFLNFARSMGLDIPFAMDDGVIHRCKTFEKRSRLNGAYMFFGNWGWVQDWAQHLEPVYWSDGKPGTEKKREQDLRRVRETETFERRMAAKRASDIVARCRFDHHPYLAKKGFHQMRGLVDQDSRLVVTMRTPAGDLASVQWINDAGEKKFLPGGQAKMTAHVIGTATGHTWYVEGFATGLTVAQALSGMYLPGRVVCGFFAANLVHLAKSGAGFVFADHDKVNSLTGKRAGEEAAKATGLPWVQSPVEGEDANDLAQRAGIRAVIDLMRSAMFP